MSSSEKFNLKWCDFQNTIQLYFSDLSQTEDFTDVTLVCEDGAQVKAHKVILSASSTFFQNLLKLNQHPHPLVYMRGMKADQLRDVVDFIYQGEVSVGQEELGAFLAIAEELKVKGVAEALSPFNVVDDNPLEMDATEDIYLKTKKIDPRKSEVYATLEEFKGKSNNKTVSSNRLGKLFRSKRSKKPKKINKVDPYLEDIYSTPVDMTEYSASDENMQNTYNLDSKTPIGNNELKELDATIYSMMEKMDRLYTCQPCGKTAKLKTDLFRHIESKHISGVIHPCSMCDKTFRTRYSLEVHMRHKVGNCQGNTSSNSI